MVDLHTTYLGIELRSPLVASSSPLCGDLDGLRRLEDAGIAAVVLPSLFEEQIEAESLEIDRMLELGAEAQGEAAGYFPELVDYKTGPEPYLELVRRAVESLGIPVIASLNGVSPGGWTHHARLIEQAGAAALELNLYGVVVDPGEDAERIEARYRALVRSVREAIHIPLAVKLSPYFTAFAHTAEALVHAGASGLVLFNRFYQPDLDLDTLDVSPRLSLSQSWELRLALRWIAVLSGHVRCSLAATGGVHTGEDALKALLVGADVAMMASALLEHGPEHATTVEDAMVDWMEAREYASVRQLCGSASRRAIADPTAYERAGYMKTLQSYAPRTPL